MKRILFQGDSITASSRLSDDINKLGIGYPSFVSARLGLDNPCKYEFINMGINGNRIVDLYARIKSDIINLEPDYMSILIGVNDVWHGVEEKNGVDAQKFERIYEMLLQEVIKELPNIKIMILEPYALPESGTQGVLCDGSDKYDTIRAEVKKRAEVARHLANKYNLVFIPLQDKLDELTKSAPVSYFFKDGVHPTNIGHEFIAREWVKFFKENYVD